MSAGRVAWPELELDEAVVARFLEALENPSGISEARHADLYLAAGGVESASRAVAIFDREMTGVVTRAIARLAAPADVLDEVLQLVRNIALVAKPGKRPAIASYNGSGGLGSWIRIVAMREAYRVLSRRGRDVGGDERLGDILAPADDPELAMMKESFRAAFRTAFATAMAALTKRQRTALRLNVLDGLSIDELGQIFDVHRATAARWLAAARSKLLRDTKQALVADLDIAPDEVESVIRLISSQLDLSLAPMLRSRE